MAKRVRVFLVCAAASGFVATRAMAQVAPHSTGPSEHVQYLRVSAKDYAFDAPDAVLEGIVTFHLVNEGSDVHQLAVVEVGIGHTVKEFFDAMRVKGVPPAWAVTVGMTPTIPPGIEAFTTIRVVPGHYVLATRVVAADSSPRMPTTMMSKMMSGAGCMD
jgi:hypothetical protein